jgi:tRNA 2-thiouridine synthesizing protein A
VQYPKYNAPIREANAMDIKADHFLDITNLLCPMTFVRAKLLAETLEVGQVLEVRLNSGEPLHNVPQTLREQGYEILLIRAEIEGQSEGQLAGVHRLFIRRR